MPVDELVWGRIEARGRVRRRGSRSSVPEELRP